MNALCTTLTGAAIGAGIMYVFDPQMGRRRRALARDKAIRFTHKAQDAAEVVGRDMSNRAQGLAAGDFTVLAGGRRAIEHPFSGGWSPSARAIMGVTGFGLVAYGMTQKAPLACAIGTIGLAMIGEGIANVDVDDIKNAAGKIYGAIDTNASTDTSYAGVNQPEGSRASSEQAEMAAARRF